MIELRHLRCFLAVAEEENFTRAAARLRIAQPAVSQQVRQLERHLGGALFERTPRQVRLTDAGHAFLPHAHAALAAIDAGRSEVQAASGALRGSLTLGLVAGITPLRVPALLGEFRQVHPDVRITVRQDPTEQMLLAIREATLDVAIVGLADHTTVPGVRLRYLHTEPLVVAVARSHRWSRRRRLALTDLRDVPVLTLTRGAGLRPLLQQACRGAGFEPTFACESNDLGLLAELAAANLGVAVLPRAIVARVAGVVVIPLTGPTLHRHLALAWRSDGTPGPVSRQFLDFATSRLATATPSDP